MDGDDVGLAQTSRKCVEHFLQIERGTVDDLEHFGGRGLLLQRLGEIACSGLHLVEQACVFDSDDGLVGKTLLEREFVGGERYGPVAVNDEDTDRLVLAPKGRAGDDASARRARAGGRPGQSAMSGSALSMSGM